MMLYVEHFGTFHVLPSLVLATALICRWRNEDTKMLRSFPKLGLQATQRVNPGPFKAVLSGPKALT